MDEQALNELLECSVCLERLDHTSKVLPCQHTFCRRCLDEIVSTKKELRCPECRTLVSYRVEDLPANILLIRLLEGLKHANQIVSSSSSSTGAFKAKPPSRRHESLNINLSHTSGSKRQFEAKALYNYDAKEPGDLSFKKGEIITVCRQIDQNWYYGELSGQDGYFPSSYVQVVSNFSSSVPQVKALYDFDIKDENEKDCLKFQKDEILQLIRKVDDNWLEGRRGDKIGIFPLSFVELNDAAKSLVASRSRSSSSSSVGVCDGGSSGTSSGRSSAPAPGSRLPSSSFQQIWHHLPQQRERVALHPPMPNTAANAAASLPPPPPLNAPLAAMASTSAQQKRHSFTATSHTHSANSSPTIQQRRSLELSPTSGAMPPTSPLHVALPPPPAPACSGNVGSASAMKLLSHLESSGQISDDNKPGSADTNNPDIAFGKTAIYSALYNYKPQKEDEVELRKGDYYTVTEKCQDGWYKGHCLKTGVNGVFPGNYVQISRQSSAFGSVNPNMPNVRAKEIPVSSSIASAADMNNQPGSVFYGSPPPPCSGNMDTPPPAPPPATVSQPHIRTDGSSASHGTSSSSTNLHRQSASGTTARSRTLHHASSVSYTTSSILAAAYHSNNNNSSGGSGNTGVGSGSALSPSVSSSILAAAYSNNNNNSSGGSNSGVVGGSTLSPSVSSSSQLSSSSTITHTVVDTPGSKSHPGSGGNTSSSSLKNAASMGSCGGAGGHHAQNLNPSSSSSSSSSSSHRNVAEFAALQHSMSASTNITPPNVVAGISSTATSHSTSKEKKEKKDRDKPSLVKRLTMGKGKKSKSPSEGEDSVVTLSSDSSHTGHTRCGSCPSDGRLTDPVQHKKYSSLDFSTSTLTKTSKQKTVIKYRCIAPYPPQGEMELELKIGDIVLVYKKWEDGWFKGALQRTGKNGLFPGSFVTKCD